MSDKPARYVISVLARDRAGIIADVSEVLFDLGANLEALSQTVVWDWFTMIICGAFPADVDAGKIREAVEASGEFSAIVLPFEEASQARAAEGEPYVVTAFGSDKPGIVRRLTRCFANRDINIEDVWNEVRDDQFIIIFHVTVPPHVDPKDANYELQQAGEEAGVAVTFRHQDIFTATNSLHVHTRG